MTIQQMFFIGAGAVGPKKNGFYSYLIGASPVVMQGVATGNDSSGNVYSASGDAQTGVSAAALYVSKTNSVGAIQFQRKITSSTYNITRPMLLCADTSGNTYMTSMWGTGSLGAQSLLLRYGNTGTISFQRQINGPAGSTGFNIGGVSVNSGGTACALVGYYASGGVAYGVVMNYTSAGVLSWQRSFSGGSVTSWNTNGSVGANSSTVFDSAGNVYSAQGGLVSTTYNLYIFKYNSTGTIQWQRQLSRTGSSLTSGLLARDTADNLIIGTGFGIVKYNSSGTYQWGISVNTGIQSVTTDPSNNIYAVNSVAGNTAVNVYAFNSSGTLLWANQITITSGTGQGFTCSPGGISYNSTLTTVTGCVRAYNSTGSYAFTFSVPVDGSLTGTSTTVGNLTIAYNSTSPTVATDSTYTSSTSTLTDAAGSAVSATGTYTDAAGALTTAVGTF